MSEMKTSEVLDLAADKIEEHGWRQAAGWTDDGRGLCLEGGIAAAMGIDDDLGECSNFEAYEDLQTCPAYRAMREYLGHRGRFLFFWNDSPARTQEEVIETLRAAAAVERAKEESLEGAEVAL